MLEIIALTLEDARRIEAGGGQRIELISAYGEGGLTPSYGLIESVCRNVKIPINIMIRPHSNNFIYTGEEIEIMMQDIKTAKKLGANGVVFGVLTPENTIDVMKLQKLLTVCAGLEVTFHRAIDETDVVASIEILSHYPQITTVLTSGGIKNHIEQNAEVIRAAISRKKHLDILLGAGLTLNNVESVKEKTMARSFHFGSAVRTGREIDMKKVKKLSQILGR